MPGIDLQAILTPDSAEEQTLALAGPPSAIGRCQIHARQARKRTISHAHRVDPDTGQATQCQLAGGCETNLPGDVSVSGLCGLQDPDSAPFPASFGFGARWHDTGVQPGSRSVLSSPLWQRPSDAAAGAGLSVLDTCAAAQHAP
jgi:hypothetical protein